MIIVHLSCFTQIMFDALHVWGAKLPQKSRAGEFGGCQAPKRSASPITSTPTKKLLTDPYNTISIFALAGFDVVRR